MLSTKVQGSEEVGILAAVDELVAGLSTAAGYF